MVADVYKGSVGFDRSVGPDKKKKNKNVICYLII